ncbi:MAG: DnaT-like ssDNA-binding domain-containing protein [Spongiibacteraceae bacterium]
MSSLIPERPIVISPSLATTIGLEEAVLLQVLNDVSTLSPATEKGSYHWFKIQLNELQKLLPFWEHSTLQRISDSLKDKGVILIESPPLTSCGHLSFAMNEAVSNHADHARAILNTPAPERPTHNTHREARQRPPLAQRTPSRGAGLLPKSWYPDEDLLQLLALNHNIPRDFALQQREDFVLYWHDRQQVSHSWPSKFRQHVLKEWRFHQSRQAVSAQQAPTKDLSADWSPSPDAMEILNRSEINPEFIADAIPEFVLYWRERGEAHSTWNSKFIAHIRRQWAKYTKAMELDYEPREIAANWQPNEDVYDILKLATIDIDFARQLVPEFVLFWRDTKQIHRSWNTKFLQHAKYQWATRHQMGQHYAGQQLSNRSSDTGRKSTFDLLTDRSWAKDLVKND